MHFFLAPTTREVLEGGRGGGSGTRKFVYQKWPDQIFSIVKFLFSRDSHFGLAGGGRGVQRGGVPPPPPMVYGHSNTYLPTTTH